MLGKPPRAGIIKGFRVLTIWPKFCGRWGAPRGGRRAADWDRFRFLLTFDRICKKVFRVVFGRYPCFVFFPEVTRVITLPSHLYSILIISKKIFYFLYINSDNFFDRRKKILSSPHKWGPTFPRYAQDFGLRH